MLPVAEVIHTMEKYFSKIMFHTFELSNFSETETCVDLLGISHFQKDSNSVYLWVTATDLFLWGYLHDTV